MTIKVGDIVQRIGWDDMLDTGAGYQWCLPVGATGQVAAVSSGLLMLTDVIGCIGDRPADTWHLAQYFEVIAARRDDAKARAQLGGIQAHSVGDAYPLIVVGIGDKWVVENVQTGAVACWSQGVRQWDSAVEAGHFIDALLAGQASKMVWTVGRPRTYGSSDGWLTLPEYFRFDMPAPEIVYELRLKMEEEKLGRPLTAYEQYQLAHAISNGD